MTLTGLGKETRICQVCKVLFITFKSHSKRMCSKKCSYLSMSTKSGRKNMTKAKEELTQSQKKQRDTAQGHRYDYELISLTGGELMFDEPSVLL